MVCRFFSFLCRCVARREFISVSAFGQRQQRIRIGSNMKIKFIEIRVGDRTKGKTVAHTPAAVRHIKIKLIIFLLNYVFALQTNGMHLSINQE